MYTHNHKLRIVIIGKTGVGKSATANTIINKNHFQSGSNGSSLTDQCQIVNCTVLGRQILVVDTPGLFDTRQNNVKVLREIQKSIGLSAPGPHAFLLLFEIGTFTEEDSKTLKLFQDHFGESFLDYAVIGFTRFDELMRKQSCEPDARQSINTFILTLPSEFQHVIRTQCRNRVVTFDNRLTEFELQQQVKNLFSVIDSIAHPNRMNHYLNKECQLVENDIRGEKDGLPEQNMRQQFTPKIYMDNKTSKKEKQRLFRRKCVKIIFKVVAVSCHLVAFFVPGATQVVLNLTGRILSRLSEFIDTK